MIVALLMMAIGFIGYNSYLRLGLEFRKFARNNTKISLGEDGQFSGYWTGCETLVNQNEMKWFRCSLDNREKPSLAIVGDSKAAALAAGLFRTSLPGARWIAFSSRGGGDFVLMPVLSDAKVYARYESEAPKAVLRTLASNEQVKVVLIATSMRHLFQLNSDDSIADLALSPYQYDAQEGLAQFIDKLLALNKKVIFLVDNPTLPHPEDCLTRTSNIYLIDKFFTRQRNLKCEISYENYLRSTDKYQTLVANLKTRYGNQLTIIETAPFLCDVTENGRCSSTEGGQPNGRPLYGITDHISDYAAGKIGRAINQLIASLSVK